MFEITTKQKASDLETYAKISPVQQRAAQQTAANWIDAADRGVNPLEDGAIEILDRILAM